MSRKSDDNKENTFNSSRGGFEPQTRSTVPGIKAFIILLILLPILFLLTMLVKQASQAEAPTEIAGNPAETPVSSLPQYHFETRAAPETVPPPQQPVTPEPPPAPEIDPALAQALQRRLGSPLSASNEQPSQQDPLGKRVRSNSLAGNQLDDLLSPLKLDRATAGVMKNRSLTITRGTFIPCGLTNELDTTLNGMLSCRISRDIYSSDGLVKLIDKGAMVDGQVNSALKDGQRRVFVVWQRILSTDGIAIDITSPGTNQLGGSGIPGQVDTLFWQRFKTAILISMLDDAMTALVNTTQRGNVANYGNTSDASSNVVSAVLPATVDIPPILNTHQGSAVGIYVARDLDFSHVYALSAN